jgi:hypothetical protein
MFKSKEKLLPLNGEKRVQGVSDEAKETFMREFKKYQEKVKWQEVN